MQYPQTSFHASDSISDQFASAWLRQQHGSSKGTSFPKYYTAATRLVLDTKRSCAETRGAAFAWKWRDLTSATRILARSLTEFRAIIAIIVAGLYCSTTWRSDERSLHMEQAAAWFSPDCSILRGIPRLLYTRGAHVRPASRRLAPCFIEKTTSIRVRFVHPWCLVRIHRKNTKWRVYSTASVAVCRPRLT